MTDPTKYPRTPHLPGSPGASEDDCFIEDLSALQAGEIVVSEKLDGEASSIYRDYVHARSTDGRHHPSQNWIRNFASQIGYKIPEGMRICGENLYAKHSIYYSSLPSYFMVFGIYDLDTCLSWDETVDLTNKLGLKTVPILYRGPWNKDILDHCMTGESQCCGEQEGYVVRTTRSFPFDRFHLHVAKWVRRDHVKTHHHWKSMAIVTNLLKEP